MKNLLLMYAAQIGISVLFVAVSILIFFFGARPALLKHKLKLGSLLIAFNAMLAGCFGSTDLDTPKKKSGDAQNRPPLEEFSCYEPAEVTDTETASAPDPQVDSETGRWDSEVECYAVPADTDIECYEVVEDSDTVGDSETEPWDTEISCYEPVLDTETESDTLDPNRGDAGDPSRNDAGDPDQPVLGDQDSDVECYMIV